MKQLLVLFVMLCAPTIGAQQQSQTAVLFPQLSIESGKELRIRETDQAKPHTVLRARRHERFAEPHLSPDGKWCTLVVTYPFDIAGGRHEQYGILVRLAGPERIEIYNLGKRFPIRGKVIALIGWTENKPATLKVLLESGSQLEIDLSAGKPSVPTEPHH